MKYTITFEQKIKNGNYTQTGTQAQFDVVVENELTGKEIKDQIENRLSTSAKNALSISGVNIKFTVKNSGEEIKEDSVVKERFLKYQVIFPDQTEKNNVAPVKEATTTTTTVIVEETTTTTTKAPKASKTTTTTTVAAEETTTSTTQTV